MPAQENGSGYDKRIILETPRMYLRLTNWEDLPSLLRIVSDPEAMRHYPQVMDEEGARQVLQRNLDRYVSHGIGMWTAVLKEGNEFAGQCGLVLQEVEGKEEVEIGYLFLRRLWGRGLATEAASACRDYGFDPLGFRRLISLIAPANTASRRVAEKVGMALEREAEWRKRQVCLYSIHSK